MCYSVIRGTRLSDIGLGFVCYKGLLDIGYVRMVGYVRDLGAQGLRRVRVVEISYWAAGLLGLGYVRLS